MYTTVIAVLIGIILFQCIMRFKYENFEMTDVKNTTGIENIIKVPQYNPKNGVLMTGSEYNTPLFLDEVPPITVIHPNSYLLDDGTGGKTGLMTNLCSKSCCSAQYPLPFDMKYERGVCENKSEFVPNNLTCNNAWQDSGCLCLTKKQAEFLYTRGGNA